MESLMSMLIIIGLALLAVLIVIGAWALYDDFKFGKEIELKAAQSPSSGLKFQ